jgi:hypothetical protein
MTVGVPSAVDQQTRKVKLTEKVSLPTADATMSKLACLHLMMMADWKNLLALQMTPKWCLSLIIYCQLMTVYQKT